MLANPRPVILSEVEGSVLAKRARGEGTDSSTSSE